jgi:hypothetical protein
LKINTFKCSRESGQNIGGTGGGATIQGVGGISLGVLEANNCDYEQKEKNLLMCIMCIMCIHGDPNK